MISDPGPDVYTRREVAALFGVTGRTVQAWARTGKITCFRIGNGTWRFPAAAVRELLAKHTQERSSAGL